MRDSKFLTKRKRSFLYDEIYSLAEDVKSYAIAPQEINNAMANGISLNELEAIHITRMIDSTESDVNTIFLDSPDVIPERFGIRISLLSQKPIWIQGLKRRIKGKAIRVVAEHKADSRYPVVSAASIIAKVVRDREIDKISDALGMEIGSGYPSDKYTIGVLKANLSSSKLNPYLRSYWKTLKNIRQLRITEFLTSKN